LFMIDNFQQKYKLLKVLENGAFSTVHLAENQENGQKYIIKELVIKKADLTRSLEIFEREGRILSRLSHPNIPIFYEIIREEGVDDNKIYLVQEFIEGNSLANLIREHHFFNEENVLQIALEITDVLEYLHSFSPPLIHRDIKPENIIYSKLAKSYLIDFGAVIDEMLHEKMKNQTLSTIIGTQSYMPFEQLRGKPVKASDIYSLGLTLIFILSHKPPDRIDSKGLYLDFKPHVNISKGFYKLIKKMVDPDWEKRYQDAASLKKDLLKLMMKVNYLPAGKNGPENANFREPVLTHEQKAHKGPDDNQNGSKKLLEFFDNNLNTNLNSSRKPRFSGMEILDILENNTMGNEVLKKIALHENLSAREQDLLIAVAVNKITDEQQKFDILLNLLKNRFLRNEIIISLINSICNNFTNESFKKDLLTKLISSHKLSTGEQNYLLEKIFSLIRLKEMIIPVLQALIDYRFLKDDILYSLISKISAKFGNDKVKQELLNRIINNHHLATREQKLFVEMVLDNFTSEDIKAALLKLLITRQYPNKNINLHITEQIKTKIRSEAHRQDILNEIKI
jgi:serine/threonine protein kinase